MRSDFSEDTQQEQYSMYDHNIYQVARVRINRVRFPTPPVVSWTGKINSISLSPFAPENLVSRDEFGRPVPRQPAISHTQAESGTGFLPISAAASIYFFNCHTPSGHPRIYWFTQMRTDGVHCRESAGTGPVVLKLISVTGAAFASPYRPINVSISLPTPTIGMNWL